MLLALLFAGCFSFTTPQHVLRHHERIERDLKISVDISQASSFTGNVGKVLADIESQLAPLPEAYRAKIGKIVVKDGFFGGFTLLAPFVGAYTDNDGTVYIRNANTTKLLQTLLMFPGNDTLIHEVTHSVQHAELRRWDESKTLSPQFSRYIVGWEYAYFGDVNGDGELDDLDVNYIAAHTDQFDLNGDGVVDHKDVELHAGNPYVSGNWLSARGLEVLLLMGMQGITARPAGYVCNYARTYAWEDAAETCRYAWSEGYVPGLYSKETGRAAAAGAWKKYLHLKKRDPLLARKVFLTVEYIAAHEQAERLSAAWLEAAGTGASVAAAAQ